MPALIEAGHIYIAQPPLYKVKRGNSESYLKDQRAFDDFLVDCGLEGSVLVSPAANGEPAAICAPLSSGRGLSRMCWMRLHMRYDRKVAEQAAIAGLLTPKLADDEAESERLASTVVERLRALSEETEKGWSFDRGADGGFSFAREVRGVRESTTSIGR